MGCAQSTEGVSPAVSLAQTYERLALDGWTDEDLTAFIGAVSAQGKLPEYDQILAAAKHPSLPEEDHTGAAFFDALAWYTDKTVIRRLDGQLTLADVDAAVDLWARQYADAAIQGGDATGRRQKWKLLQKLKLIEREIKGRAAGGQGSFYPYSPHELNQVDASKPWNEANTIDTAEEFEARVIAGSYAQPVLVKYGLPYCAHCLLLEHLGSVPAAAEKYRGKVDVVKLWWDPHDPAKADITAVARAQGVTSSPFFMVYSAGKVLAQGYAFPDENGDGLEDLLAGVV